MNVPPSIIVVTKGQHMNFHRTVETLFGQPGCVARMNIYSTGGDEVETVYIEFRRVPDTSGNRRHVRSLLQGELSVGPYVMRPQMLF